MKRAFIYLLFAGLFLSASHPLQAQFDIIKSVIDMAAAQRTPPPATPRPSRPKPRPNKAKESASEDEESKPRRAPSNPSVPSGAKRFDGTWLATRSKTSADGERISQIFTMVIKSGKASKTLDTTNTSVAEKPFHESAYELQRKWTYESTDVVGEGSSLTIQWSPGQLSDWTPKTIPNHLIDNFGTPSAETSVYVLKGDELVRINDPNGVTYRRAR
jgi:hypothetical protein